ncbi:MAG: putative toxin-antitoxin system toxin component, PIN family [Rubrivivax sp.]
MPRAVLDTNVVLSALVFAGGSTARLRQAWQAGRLLPLVSTATAQELMRVLAYPKFKLDAQAQQELLADYLPWAEAVAVPEPPPRVPECRDVDDLPFLHLAVAGRADVLVSGDADLLALSRPGAPTRGPRLRFRLLTVQAFLESLPPASA